MRLIILICAIFPLSSCGSAGKLLGGIARMPVVILKTAVKFEEDGTTQNAPIINVEDATNLNDMG